MHRNSNSAGASADATIFSKHAGLTSHFLPNGPERSTAQMQTITCKQSSSQEAGSADLQQEANNNIKDVDDRINSVESSSQVRPTSRAPERLRISRRMASDNACSVDAQPAGEASRQTLSYNNARSVTAQPKALSF